MGSLTVGICGLQSEGGGTIESLSQETAKETQRGGKSLFLSGRQDGRGPLTALSFPSNDYLIIVGRRVWEMSDSF